ncbi:MAG: hypothetical protein ACP5KN_05275 [Armatimonadota bacterium]
MRRALAVTAALLVGLPSAADEIRPGPSPEVAAENADRGPEILRIRIVNRAGGSIAISRDAGATWLRVGSVTAPATAVNPDGYTASRWARDASVAAAAVNAIHVKVANHPQTGRGIVFSVIPAGGPVGAATGHATSVIATDIPGGDALFGGGLGPYVSSPVLVEREGELVRLPADYVPAEGDALVIRVLAPPQRVASIEFDNSFGGLIRLRYVGGEQKVIGTVLRPVLGVGRFEGTRDAAPGRIRANHPGVIDISTSPAGLVGGFQIVPSGHADSPETTYVRTGTQWMVVGPVSALDPSWEGIAPLFSGYIRPSYRPDDIWGGHEDWMRRLLSRCQVQARTADGEWGLMPRIAIDPEAPEDGDTTARGREGLWRIHGSLHPYDPLPSAAYTALEGVTGIRILLPRAQFWPGGGE